MKPKGLFPSPSTNEISSARNVAMRVKLGKQFFGQKDKHELGGDFQLDD